MSTTPNKLKIIMSLVCLTIVALIEKICVGEIIWAYGLGTIGYLILSIDILF